MNRCKALVSGLRGGKKPLMRPRHARSKHSSAERRLGWPCGRLGKAVAVLLLTALVPEMYLKARRQGEAGGGDGQSVHHGLKPSSADYPPQYFSDIGRMFLVCPSRSQLGGTLYTPSWHAALNKCRVTPQCTAVTRSILSGQTILCQGKHRRLRWMVWWRTAVQGGCEAYDHRLVELNRRSSSPNLCRQHALDAFHMHAALGACASEKELLEATRTRTVQSAAARCLVDPNCGFFSRHALSGQTIFCRNGMVNVSGSATGAGMIVNEPSRAERREASVSQPRGLLRSVGGSAHTAMHGVSGQKHDNLMGMSLIEDTSTSSKPSSRNWAAREHSLLWDHRPMSLDSSRTRTTNADSSQSSKTEVNISGTFKILHLHLVCEPQQVVAQAVTESLEEAVAFCASQVHCTAFSRRKLEGDTHFCQGFFFLQNSQVMRPENALEWEREAMVSGVRSGCSSYTWQKAKSDIEAGKPPPCVLSLQPTCPHGLFPVPYNFESIAPLETRVTCEECEDRGACPPLATFPGPSKLHASSFRQTLDDFSSDVLRLHVSMGGAFNPAIFKHGGEVFLAFRISSATRCKGLSIGGDWMTDEDLPSYYSHVGMCRLDPDSMVPVPKTCVSISSIPKKNIQGLDAAGFAPEEDRGGYMGPEDPRPFSYQGQIYLMCNLAIKYIGKRLPPSKRSTWLRRLVLVPVTPSGQVLRSVVIQLPIIGNASQQLHDEKNLIPLVTSDSVYLISQALPFEICRLDLHTGVCARLEGGSHRGDEWAASRAAQQMKDLEQHPNTNLNHIRGSSGFVRTSHGFLSMVHQVSQMSMGRVYSHKWLLLSLEPPFQPKWISAPFRLPATDTTSGEDIQFSSGLEHYNGHLVVSYGVSDCFSWIAEVPFPMELSSATESKTSTDKLEVNFITPVPKKQEQLPRANSEEQHIRLRWESPVQTMSGFATVVREMTSQSFSDPTILFTLYDTDPGSGAEVEAGLQQAIRGAILRSNIAPSPDVTVRLFWPINFQPPAAGLWVQYLPWEFEAMPRAWVDMLNSRVDEVWVPAQFIKDAYVRSGLHRNKTFVVPHGVSADLCANALLGTNLSHALVDIRKRFVFLFHGGLLFRKGIDILLAAYHKTFTQRDDVLLLVHSVYSDYEVRRLTERATAWWAKLLSSNQPSVVYIKKHLTSMELRWLYKAADVLVHPSRSEGWGLSIGEAMAHSLPVILPEYGPPLEFVSNHTAFIFPAHRSKCTQKPCSPDSHYIFTPDWYAEDGYMWSEFSPTELGRMMRYVYENPEEVQRKSMQARKHICTNVTWERAYALMRRRVQHLIEKHNLR